MIGSNKIGNQGAIDISKNLINLRELDLSKI
jgi:hypothetical protein